MKNYLDIVVVISLAPDGLYAVRISSQDEGNTNAKIRLPLKALPLHKPAALMAGMPEATRAINLPTRATGPVFTEDFGLQLFELLFQGKARELLAKTQKQAEDKPNTGVRIRLSMNLEEPGMAEVASLPWELMCQRDALSIQSALVRNPDVFGATRPAPYVAPLRIMVVMSNPQGTNPLNLAEERRQIEEGWGRAIDVKVDFVDPTRTAIRGQLRENPYHVVHYMGHGDVDKNGDGILLLQKEDGSPDPTRAVDFAEWLEGEPLRLVFLNACKSGATSTLSGALPFAGGANARVRSLAPAVVAMQSPISDKAAIVFARTFYEGIIRGVPVDAAVVDARRELRATEGTSAEWSTPVLFLRSKDGALFERAALPPVTPTANDPWGADVGDALCVYLATPDPNLLRRHGQLSQALKGLKGVRVVDMVDTSSVKGHAGAVDALVRRADLCVHLLGANPGLRLDEDDGDPLKTFPLVELDFGLAAARSQLVIITPEDKENIGVKKYAARLEEFATLDRGKGRFELVITDKNRFAEAVQARLDALKLARQAQAAEAAVQTATPTTTARTPARFAFIDSHVVDKARAVKLATFLLDRNINASVQASETAMLDPAQLDKRVQKTSLYVVVAGSVNAEWVMHRQAAILKAAMRTQAPVLIANYSGTPPDGADITALADADFDISDPNAADPSWVQGLLAPAADRA